MHQVGKKRRPKKWVG